ncbi:MAG: response regulator [Patescibacteria group bacterium]|mgnify:CR=1 FL=1
MRKQSIFKLKTSERTILVLEDDMALQNIISMRFQRSGFRVMTARSVKEALDLLLKFPSCDAFWVDHNLLGEESGLDFVIKVKKIDAWRKTPIYVVTNNDGDDKKKRYMHYLKLGIDNYLTKYDHELNDIVLMIKKDIQKTR